nr:MAG TPA: Head tail connector [Caudoviricetes sp.]
MNEDLNLIKRAFSDLEQHKKRFLECERAFRAEYEDEDNRTTKRKNSERSHSKLYIPLIKTTIFIIHAIFKTSFMSDRCPIEITRIGRRSDNDLILQNALTAVLKNRWKKKEHRVGLSKAVMSALYLPLGIVNLFYDKEQGDIATRFIPITDLAFDKHASDINDIEYVCYKWRQSIRQVEEKIKTKFYKSKDKDRILGSKTEWSQRVQMKDIYKKIYVNGRQMWELKSFANDYLVRETRFSTLPFHFGYCMDAMPSIDESTRENENAVYGSCVPEVVKEIQKEYNIKRNQKIDITENQIDPSFIVDKTKGVVTVSDVMARKKVIRVETDMGTRVSDVIMPFPVPPTYQLSEEIAMLSKEYEIATGVNSVMTGQTGPSDRRAMGALQTVNAASSMRIESMMQTLLETMLSSYAQHFVELLYRFVSDDEFIKITEDENIIEAIGTLAERKANRLDFDVSVNFGTTIANEVKISQLNGLLGVLAQNQISSPQITGEIVKEVLTLILGENAPIEQVDQAMAQMMAAQEAAQAEAVTQDKEAQIKNEPSEEDKEMAALVNGGI